MKKKQKCGAATFFAGEMEGMDASPYVERSRYSKIEHWFTKSGWEEFGMRIVEEYQVRKYYYTERLDLELKIRTRKTKPKMKTYWKDEHQVMLVKENI
jgi:hypothetical protein